MSLSITLITTLLNSYMQLVVAVNKIRWKPCPWRILRLVGLQDHLWRFDDSYQAQVSSMASFMLWEEQIPNGVLTKLSNAFILVLNFSIIRLRKQVTILVRFPMITVILPYNFVVKPRAPLFRALSENEHQISSIFEYQAPSSMLISSFELLKYQIFCINSILIYIFKGFSAMNTNFLHTLLKIT